MVLQHRVISKEGEDAGQILVWWKGLPSTTATWEDTKEFKRAYPDYNLEEKIEVHRGSIDRSQVEA